MKKIKVIYHGADHLDNIKPSDHLTSNLTKNFTLHWRKVKI